MVVSELSVGHLAVAAVFERGFTLCATEAALVIILTQRFNEFSLYSMTAASALCGVEVEVAFFTKRVSTLMGVLACQLDAALVALKALRVEYTLCRLETLFATMGRYAMTTPKALVVG